MHERLRTRMQLIQWMLGIRSTINRGCNPHCPTQLHKPTIITRKFKRPRRYESIAVLCIFFLCCSSQLCLRFSFLSFFVFLGKLCQLHAIQILSFYSWKNIPTNITMHAQRFQEATHRVTDSLKKKSDGQIVAILSINLSKLKILIKKNINSL